MRFPIASVWVDITKTVLLLHYCVVKCYLEIATKIRCLLELDMRNYVYSESCLAGGLLGVP